MKKLGDKLSISSQGLKYKLTLAFALMAIIPLLVCVYLFVNFIMPNLESIYNISLIIILSLIIALLGWTLARKIVEPIVDLAIGAKMIAGGQYDRKIVVREEDEIGDLANSINLLSEKIRANMQELRTYGQKTTEINIDIHRKVLALSSLLQISDVISSGTMKLDDVLNLIIERISQAEDGAFGALYMPQESDGVFRAKKSFNLKDEGLDGVAIKPGEGPLGEALASGTTLVADSSSKRETKDIRAFKESHKLNNMIMIPIRTAGKNLAVILVGNRKGEFRYSEEELDLVYIFAKQIAIAIENSILLKRAEELAVMDELTGLFNKKYIAQRLDEEVRRAASYQRACSFVVFNIDDFEKFRASEGQLSAEGVLKKFSKTLKDKTGPVGKAARIGSDEFALLLPEVSKKEAIGIAEEIRKGTASTLFSSSKLGALTVSGGVAENPLDGSTGDEIFRKAVLALREAKMKGKNRVVA
jgi:diguanylate cyclase (GGDEF)-like protein